MPFAGSVSVPVRVCRPPDDTVWSAKDVPWVLRLLEFGGVGAYRKSNWVDPKTNTTLKFAVIVNVVAAMLGLSR